ncbi:MAG: META domain-containing protein [Terracidiphilus sp.]
MRIARLITTVALAVANILALPSFSLQAQPSEQEITVKGKLVRAMAIGAESTGWVLELDPAINIGGKQLTSIQVSDPKAGELEIFTDKRVRITGTISQRTGVETGEQPVLNVASIKQAKPAQAAPASNAAFNLSGSEWLLEDLAGTAADHGKATLTFPEAGKIAGSGSCNRFFGSAQINGDAIKLGGMGSTRMACPEPVMNQESKYLEALQAAERFEWKDPYLLIYCKGFEKPLRFTRMPPTKPVTP